MPWQPPLPTQVVESISAFPWPVGADTQWSPCWWHWQCCGRGVDAQCGNKGDLVLLLHQCMHTHTHNQPGSVVAGWFWLGSIWCGYWLFQHRLTRGTHTGAAAPHVLCECVGYEIVRKRITRAMMLHMHRGETARNKTPRCSKKHLVWLHASHAQLLGCPAT